MTGGELLLGQSMFQWLTMYGYWVLPILIILLGPIAGFTAGVFASLGVFNPFAVFAIWLVTTTTTDGLLYALGKFGRKILTRFKRSRHILYRIHKAEHSSEDNWVTIFRKHFIKIFFFIKISPTVTITDVLAVVSGVLNIKFKRLYIASFLGQIIWSGVFVSMGYYFGGAIQDIEFLVNTTGVVLFALFLLVFVYIRFIHQYLMGKMSIIVTSIRDLLSKTDVIENDPSSQ